MICKSARLVVMTALLLAVQLAALSQSNNVLPNRTLLSFSGLEKNEKVELKGNLSASHTYDIIRIEHSANGSYFEYLAEIPVTNGGSSEFPFKYIDQDPVNGTNFYRVRLVNSAQGLHEVSNILVVKTDFESVQQFHFYNTVVKIADPSVILQSKENTDLVLEIIDMSGRSVYRKKLRVNKGVNLIDLANLRASTGFYVLTAGTGRDMITHKIILQ